MSINELCEYVVNNSEYCSGFQEVLNRVRYYQIKGYDMQDIVELVQEFYEC